MKSLQASPSPDIICKIFTIWCQFDAKWPLTLSKHNRLLYSMWYTYIPNMRSVQASQLEILCLQGFHNLTPNDLWPPPKTIWFLYSIWYTYIPNMRSVQASLLAISCLQAMHHRHTYTHTYTPTHVHTYTHTPSWMQRLRLSSKPKITPEEIK